MSNTTGLCTACYHHLSIIDPPFRIIPRIESSDSSGTASDSRMLRLLRRQQGFSTPPLRWYPSHLSPRLLVCSLRSYSSSMSHPIVSSGPVQIPALVSQHTNAVSSEEPKPQKKTKPKAAPAFQFPLEVCRHSTIITLMPA